MPTNNNVQLGPIQLPVDDYRIFKGNLDDFFLGLPARARALELNEQTSERFYAASVAALSAAEDLDDSVLCLDAEGQATLDRATELRYAGTRDAIMAYALLGEEAPAELVGALRDVNTADAFREIVGAQYYAVCGFGSGVPIDTRTVPFAVITDYRTTVYPATYTVNAGRLLEELRHEAVGAGPDAVIAAAKRAELPYEPPTLTTTTQG